MCPVGSLPPERGATSPAPCGHDNAIPRRKLRAGPRCAADAPLCLLALLEESLKLPGGMTRVLVPAPMLLHLTEKGAPDRPFSLDTATAHLAQVVRRGNYARSRLPRPQLR